MKITKREDREVRNAQKRLAIRCLQDLEITKHTISERKNDIINSTPPPKEVPIKSSDITDDTFNKTKRIMTDEVIKTLERKVFIVNDVLARYGPLGEQIYKYRYRQGKMWGEIAYLTGYNETYIIEQNTKIVNELIQTLEL